jgi:hypothetical protein
MVTLREIFLTAYALAESNALLFFVMAVSIPLAGTGAALVGRGGRTDRDGLLYANVFILVAVLQFALAMIIGFVGIAFLGRSIWDTELLLILAPWTWLILSVIGLRRVFPLSELATWRSVVEAFQFFAVCAALVWFFSMFRGWGIWFIGGLAELLIILVLAVLLIRRLFQRAFRTQTQT